MLKNFKTYQLAVQFYRSTRRANLPACLRDQFNRAASSIALNLSEGWGRRTMKDRLRFYQIALGSIRECQAIVALEPEALNHDQVRMLDALGGCTYKLITLQPSP